MMFVAHPKDKNHPANEGISQAEKLDFGSKCEAFKSFEHYEKSSRYDWIRWQFNDVSPRYEFRFKN